uniref:Uncharacterized protein n=1 Tax=Arundo donax TaxID=35708 RepID=A0A0A9BPW4_ARUDO
MHNINLFIHIIINNDTHTTSTFHNFILIQDRKGIEIV